MILKLRTSLETPKAWRYLEANDVQVGAVPEPPKKGDMADYVEYHLIESGRKRGFVTVSFFGKNGQATEVTTDMEVYLLNDRGETIEALHK